MAISAARVKTLRDRTGAGMMDAKKALTETAGDMDAAVDWLRTKGLAKAAKKSGRTAADGLVALSVEGGRGVAVEVNAETDFVAKNAEFQEMVAAISRAALEVDDIEALAATDIGGKSVAETITEKIATIGENMSLRRMQKISGEQIVSYVHNALGPDMGKIGVLVAMRGGDVAFGRQVAMHVAAANPSSLAEGDLDPAVVEHEKAVLGEQARASGKPEKVVEQMVTGRMKKFFSEVTLLGQSFVVNPDQTVGEAAEQAGAEITGFVRLALGEGIEPEEG